jgi:hypothetical protein
MMIKFSNSREASRVDCLVAVKSHSSHSLIIPDVFGVGTNLETIKFPCQVLYVMKEKQGDSASDSMLQIHFKMDYGSTVKSTLS